MENIKSINHYHIVKRDWRKILVVTLVFVLLSLLFSLVQPFLYQATVSVLVLQKSSFSIDAYSASKSEERIANKLGQVVYSSSFLTEVLNSGFDIDSKYFPADELARREKWAKTVETESPVGLSKLNIAVYHTDPEQALQISQAIAYILTTDRKEYVGIDDVDLRILDSPLVSNYPVRPNIVLNIFLGLIVGGILGVVFVIVTYDPSGDKLFEIPKLIMNEDRDEARSIEKDMSEIAIVPEIEELDDIEEMAEAEQVAEGLAEEPEKIEEFIVPDISESIDAESVGFAESAPEVAIPAEPAPPVVSVAEPRKDLPKFEDEYQITSMPKID